MNYLFSVIAFLISTFVLASIDITGEIEGYDNKEVFVYNFLNNSEILLSKVKTDNKGKFHYHNDEEYTGVIKLLLADNLAKGILFSTNEKVQFKAKSEDKKIVFQSFVDHGNQMYLSATSNEDYSTKSVLLAQLLEVYSSKDPFYKAISNEQKKLASENGVDFSKYPFIDYYNNLNQNYLQFEAQNQEEGEKVADSILYHLVNDNEDLEKTSLMNSLINVYITYRVSKYTNSVEQIQGLKNAIDDLLDQTVIETSRGQNVLVSVINLLKGYGLDYIAEEYIDMANQLTCTIHDGLKKTISAAENTEMGATFPNFNFSETIKGKKSLYDIDSKYKLVIFWGSFCPHCQAEKPLLKAYYPEFLSLGGEIIAYSIETEKSEYEKFIYGLPWFNDSDLLYWSSPVVEQYGIEGTPTMFLLDANNVIIGKGAKLELIKSKIN